MGMNVGPPLEQKWFVTFGQKYNHENHSLKTVPPITGDSYMIITASSEQDARQSIIDLVGTQWAFIYPISDLERQLEKYDLFEVKMPEETSSQEI